ncbi:MAG: transglutaminaseTgpA domain-containing protein [Saezia sp.]
MLKATFDKKTALLLGKKMPREQRDVLFTLAVLTFILIPHFFYLPLWTIALTLGTLLWRAWISKDPARKLPGKFVKFVLLCAYVTFTLLTYKRITGPDAGGCLLVVLIALKTMELRARRDALVIFYLGFFLIKIGFFHSQNIPTAFILLIGLTGLLTALVNAYMVAGYPPLKDAFKVALKLVLWGAPLMVVLFMTFPRLDPLWGLPDSALAKTGVSDSLSINSISQLAQNRAIAFRIQFDGKAPATKEMYFRGPVLDFFDGRSWRARDIPSQPFTSKDESAFYHDDNPISYEITMESTNQSWLFTLELTTDIKDLQIYRPQLNRSYQWISNEIIMSRTRFRGTAHMNYRISTDTPQQWLEIDTKLPDAGNSRTRQWAAELMQNPEFSALSVRGKADWVLQHIHQKEFFYTLTPPTGYTPDNSADQFWFDYQSGFCEHYASSFVILMRALGIPARIVTGYLGAEQNYVDNYWIVRQSNAHAWTEIWQEKEGWIRIDPTAAIAPERVLTESLTQESNAAGGFDGLGFITKLVMRWDALENAWNQWVLAYNTDTGVGILERLGFKSPNWITLLKVLFSFLAIGLGTAFVIYKWRHRQKDSWLKVYNNLCKKLQNSGAKANATMSPRTVVQSLENEVQHQPMYKQVCDILLELEKLRYAPSLYTKDEYKQHLKRLKLAVQQLKIS